MTQHSERLFIQVVEAGSFKRAAEQLGLEPSSLSRNIAALEERLNVKLLHRSTRHTRPTELGQEYYLGLRRVLDDQVALEERITSRVESIEGNLRVSAPVDFGAQFVAPILREMQMESPGLSIEITLGSAYVDLIEEGLDVAVRIGELPESSLVAKKLGEVRRVLVASPEYLQARGVPEKPDDLALHNFVLYSPIQARSDIEFSDGSQFPNSRIRSNIMVNSVRAIRDLVNDGAGIHLGPEWVFKDDLHRGNVIRVLPDQGLKSFPAYAVYTARAYLPRKTRQFVQRLSARMSEWD